MSLFQRIKKFIQVYRLPYEVRPPYTHIVQAGDPILRKPSDYVQRADIKSAEIQDFVQYMKKAIVAYKFVGLSACQVGVPLRIFALHLPQSQIQELYTPEEIKAREIQPIPLQVWINPELTANDNRYVTDTEQCGSLVSFCADIKRYYKVTLNGLDENGKNKSLTATGFTARIIQHEIDHLNGILYTDIMYPKTFRCIAWQKINELNGFVELRYYPKVQR